ncbi:hypothetical protein ES703_120133 [subsurface metagenome]
MCGGSHAEAISLARPRSVIIEIIGIDVLKGVRRLSNTIIPRTVGAGRDNGVGTWNLDE